MAPSAPSRKRGQILVLLTILGTTFVIFFGMVVSIGQLVHAKINLQNSVDFAAMVGASWQARYLNHVALVNYRMRQNYRFLIYDLYVTQSRFNKGWIDEVGAGGYMKANRVNFGICQQVRGYAPKAPGESGAAAGSTTNMCKNVEGSGKLGNVIPSLIPNPAPTIDPVIIGINAAIMAYDASLKAMCDQFGGQNKAYAEYMTEKFVKKNEAQLDELVKIIDAFSKSFIAGGPAYQAVYSTFGANLIQSLGSSEIEFSIMNDPVSIAMDSGGVSWKTSISSFGAASGLAIRDYFETTTTAISNLNFAEFKSFAGGCKTEIKSFSPASGIPMGFARQRGVGDRPKTPLLVVVKASVKPRLLFWPAELTPKLTAIGAAKPFGSRVAPPWSMIKDEVVHGGIANMSFYPGDLSVGNNIHGIGDTRLISKLLGVFPGGAAGLDSGYNDNRPHVANSSPNCKGGSPSFMCYALAPTQYEALYYNPFIFPSTAATPDLREAFPLEVPIRELTPDYGLEDRNGPATAGWHYSYPIDAAPWFASEAQLRTSWSPAIAVGGAPPANLARDGRMGYQIKLISIQQACEEIKSAESSGSRAKRSVKVDGDSLSNYCDEVFY